LIEQEIERFFSLDYADSYREELIMKYGVNYIFWGPLEKELGAWNPASAEYLIEINSIEDYVIYQTVVTN
jgi:uncharacterized membrane protein